VCLLVSSTAGAHSRTARHPLMSVARADASPTEPTLRAARDLARSCRAVEAERRAGTEEPRVGAAYLHEARRYSRTHHRQAARASPYPSRFRQSSWQSTELDAAAGPKRCPPCALHLGDYASKGWGLRAVRAAGLTASHCWIRAWVAGDLAGTVVMLAYRAAPGSVGAAATVLGALGTPRVTVSAC
jgi:hypothetical protein